MLDVTDEIDRKTLETIRLNQARYKSGVISRAQYQEILQAINDTIRGLCDEDIIAWLDRERMEIGFNNAELVHEALYDAGENRIAVVTTAPAMGRLVYANVVCGENPQMKQVRAADDIDAHGQINHKAKTIRKALVDAGYRTLI